MAMKKAEETGSINKEKIIKDGGFMFFDKTIPPSADASKYTKSKSIKEVMERFDFTEDEAIEAIKDAGFIPR